MFKIKIFSVSNHFFYFVNMNSTIKNQTRETEKNP